MPAEQFAGIYIAHQGIIMNRHDFFYELPHELIAQHPLEKRTDSRLLILNRKTGEYSDSHFYNLTQFLRPGDLLVANNSKVIPARIMGHKSTGASVEILLLRDLGSDKWEAIVKPGKRLKAGAEIVVNDSVSAVVTEELPDGNRIVRFNYDKSVPFVEILDKIGAMPLPPYITEKLSDSSRYQTVYAKLNGSAAAPTAGLHFTPELIKSLSDMNVGFTELTLHVGLGTFRPVKEDDITHHLMHSEYYSLSAETAQLINKTKENGGRIIAVGTTSVRTLESVYRKLGKIAADSGETDIFIYPGYEFRAVDGIITNFHLPESTLIMLVSAFAGYENTMNAYHHAVDEKYRFFSFGDAMFII